MHADLAKPAAILARTPPAVRLSTDGLARRQERVIAIDVLRGLVMIVMALDHTRDYFGPIGVDPTNLATASTALFLTRWVTHFCAPTFFLLTGAGAALTRGRRTSAGLSRFLLTRGLWLVVLELTVMRALWQFNVDYRVTILNVLWALGWSTVALAAISRLPLAAVIAVGAALVGLHNLADPVAPSAFGAWAPLWTILHRPGILLATDRTVVLLAYPVVPWIGVTALGFALGHIFDRSTWTAEERRTFLLRLGVALCAGFVALRALDGFGDPRPWTAQPTVLRTALSFVNTTKYPPSLLFLLMTLGPAMLLLRVIDRRSEAVGDTGGDGGVGTSSLPWVYRRALVYGRVPLFYYLLHVALIHSLAVGVSVVRFHTARWMIESPTLDRFPITQPPGWPLSLPWVYVAWATVVLVAYPCCRWYGDHKARSPRGWMSYL